MLFLENFRCFFPHVQDQIYLNHAAISPFSTQVVTALYQYIEQRHRTNIENYSTFQPILQQTRERLAQILHTQADRIAFCANTSSALNILATGLPWKAGDRILLNRLEFPANVYPFENLRSLGVAIDYVEPRGYYLHLEDFANALTPHTRLLSISQVQFLTGQHMDLAALGALCRHNGTWLSVDGIQALGATTLDVENLGIDFVASGSHKWLMGPTGVGFLYISRRLQDVLRPVYAGWLSVENAWDLLDYTLQFRSDARRFETGTLNFMGIAGLHAALELLLKADIQAVETQIRMLTDWLYNACVDLGLQVITPAAKAERLGILTVEFPQGQAQILYEALAKANIDISLREQKFLRFSPHFYNTQAELEQVIQVLESLL